jgi:hypothetical protein
MAPAKTGITTPISSSCATNSASIVPPINCAISATSITPK